MSMFDSKVREAGTQQADTASIALSDDVRALVESFVSNEVARQVALSDGRREAATPLWLRASIAFPMSHEALGRKLAEDYQDHYRFGVFGDDAKPKWWRRHGNTWLSEDADRHLRDCWSQLRKRLLENAPLDCFENEGLRRIAFLESCRTAHDCSLILDAAATHIGPPT